MIFFSLAKRLFRQADGNGGSKSAVPVSCYLNICCDPACTPVAVSSSMSRSLYFVSMPQLRHSWTHPRRRCCPSLRAPWGCLQASRRCSSCRTWSGPRCRTEGDKGAGADLSMDRGNPRRRLQRKAHRVREVGAREHVRAQPVDRAGPPLWVPVVGP